MSAARGQARDDWIALRVLKLGEDRLGISQRDRIADASPVGVAEPGGCILPRSSGVERWPSKKVALSSLTRGSSVKRPMPDGLGQSARQLVRERIDRGTEDHPDRSFPTGACPESRGHAPLVGERAGEPAMGGLRQEVQSAIEVGLAAPVRSQDDVDRPEIQAESADRTVPFGVKVTDHQSSSPPKSGT